MNSTNRILLLLHQQRENLSRENLLVYLLLGSKLRQFGQDNNIRISSLIEKITNLQKQYFVFKNNMPELTADTNEPIMLPDMIRADYDKKYDELMDVEVKIII